jgi:hypothetical protein
MGNDRRIVRFWAPVAPCSPADLTNKGVRRRVQGEFSGQSRPHIHMARPGVLTNLEQVWTGLTRPAEPTLCPTPMQPTALSRWNSHLLDASRAKSSPEWVIVQPRVGNRRACVLLVPPAVPPRTGVLDPNSALSCWTTPPARRTSASDSPMLDASRAGLSPAAPSMGKGQTVDARL